MEEKHRIKKYKHARYDVLLAYSLAQKGLIDPIGWYADGDITLGQSKPDWIQITPNGCFDTKLMRFAPEIHILANLTAKGKAVLDKYSDQLATLLMR